MVRLTILKLGISTAKHRRIKALNSERRRVSGSARVSAKRRIFQRDGGLCCLCGCVVSLHDSQLDHRRALQFGGSNDDENMWTLCATCHEGKSKREAATGLPDELSMNRPAPGVADDVYVV
ncbi:HNH endonuclease [Escherichia albertii]|uniref:HNH endonuclease n=1 Tax=Escherichia albertii TaxID=208962 RepID=UPI0017CEC8B8|nr:HNH endonuclease [Escherichia albertii]HCZ5333289.1 HNH endonuclease [Escherichia albertii]